MTQEWFIENGFSVILDYVNHEALLYHNNAKLQRHSLTNPSFGKDKNHFTEFYPMCLSHKRNLLINNVINDSDIGYDPE